MFCFSLRHCSSEKEGQKVAVKWACGKARTVICIPITMRWRCRHTRRQIMQLYGLTLISSARRGQFQVRLCCRDYFKAKLGLNLSDLCCNLKEAFDKLRLWWAMKVFAGPRSCFTGQEYLMVTLILVLCNFNCESAAKF